MAYDTPNKMRWNVYVGRRRISDPRAWLEAHGVTDAAGLQTWCERQGVHPPEGGELAQLFPKKPRKQSKPRKQPEPARELPREEKTPKVDNEEKNETRPVGAKKRDGTLSSKVK